MALSVVELDEYEDLLLEHKHSSDAAWASRCINFVKAYNDRASASFGHKNIKREVLFHPSIQSLIRNAENNGLFKTEIPKAEVETIIDEIAHSYRLPVIRWLGYFLIKILKKTVSGLYVNKRRLDQLKSTMGDCPVIFVPSHRSYADFILMAFICFDSDIDVPCVAAGMDFYSMWLMGDILRKCKAFFMRRSFVSDPLYREVFESYVGTLIRLGESPVEFFIEGTRSRTGKSLWPKYGFLSMVSECYMDGSVADLKFVPISFTYDRPLEEKLFAFELLGVPKPKESTKGLLKALADLNQTYGNVIATVGSPISARDFLPRAPRPRERVCSNEFVCVKRLASEIVTAQQSGQVVTWAHLLAITVFNNLVDRRTNELSLALAVGRAEQLSVMFNKAGARMMLFQGSAEESVRDAVKSNPRLYALNEGNIIFLDVFEVPSSSEKSLVKGHKLSPTTMSVGIPRIMLQNLINASLHFIVGHAFFLTSVYLVESQSCTGTVSDLVAQLRQIFQREFVLFHPINFDWVVPLLLECACITEGDYGAYFLGRNRELVALVIRLLQPYYFCYFHVGVTLLKSCHTPMTLRDIVVLSQRHLENVIQKTQGDHFYSLTIDTITNCVKSLEDMGAISATQSSPEKLYGGNEKRLDEVIRLLSSYCNRMFHTFSGLLCSFQAKHLNLEVTHSILELSAFYKPLAPVNVVNHEQGSQVTSSRISP